MLDRKTRPSRATLRRSGVDRLPLRGVDANAVSGGVVIVQREVGESVDLVERTVGIANVRGATSASLLVHNALECSAAESAGRYVFTTAGDSFAGGDSRASDAASAIQARMADAVWPGPESRVRIGVHLGRPRGGVVTSSVR